MPREKDFKRRVRRRMDETGERYTEARERLRSARPAIEWRLVGERPGAYELTVDGDTRVVRCVGDPGDRPGGLGASVPAAEFRGRRVRFAAQLQAEAVTGGGALWMRVDGANGEPLAFGSTERDPIEGTTGWLPRSVALDVPPDAEGIALGSILRGRGALRLAGVSLEAVPDAEPLAGFVRLGDWVLDGTRPDRYDLRREDGVMVLRSVAEARSGHGSMSRAVPAAAHLGGRVRLSASVRGEVTHGWAGLWMRVDDAEGRMLRFDNMEGRALRGPFHWTDVAVVLDVPREAASIAHGMLLSGEGVVRVAGLRLEAVDDTVAATGALPVDEGWFLAGPDAHEYVLRTERDGGRRVGVLRGLADAESGLGAAAQAITAEPWRGRRVAFRVALRGEDVDGEASVWLGATRLWTHEEVEADRPAPLTGTFDWTARELVLDVPQDAALVALVVSLQGRGTVRIADASLDGRELGFEG